MAPPEATGEDAERHIHTEPTRSIRRLSEVRVIPWIA
jgi:hypothetical protein